MPLKRYTLSLSSRSFSWLFLLLLTGTLVSCTDDVVLDVAPLERELLIVWLATEYEDPAVMASYTDRAVRSWQRLRTRYANAPLTPREQATVRLMDLWMLGLRQAVAGRHYHRAGSQLRQLQDQLRALRPEYGIGHPADLLYTFHRQWEWVDEISRDQLMCLLEWNEYKAAFLEARRSWEDFQRYAPPYAERMLPGRTQRSAEAEFAGLEVTAALDDFAGDLQRADHGLMTPASITVHDRFLHYLAIAVDYPRPADAR